MNNNGKHEGKEEPDKEDEVDTLTGDDSEEQSVSGTAIPGTRFPVVGIGASAGGLPAMEEFFSAFSADRKYGMAFVIVQHMAPNHKSMLAEIIGRYTSMQVSDVKDGMAVERDHVYVIPPNQNMVIIGGVLNLLEPAEARGHRMPIDYFFRSLASDRKEWAIGIILSGTGSDGSEGVRAIKAEGGMAMAQNPESSEYNGMPLSAIDTGMIDYSMEAKEMPEKLQDYVSQVFAEKSHPSPNIEEAMKIIFSELLTRTGHDFSQYKTKTLDRRIRRRMAVSNIKRIDGYARYLQQKPEESEALFRDLLINVTNFFRNPKVFEALEEQVLPSLFEDKSSNDAIRIWVVGCSTGEEAYSLAILVYEYMEKIEQTFKVQIFATDIDYETIEHARKGIYPANISADVSPERLHRFFTHDVELDTYAITKNIRDMIIFSEQDVIQDPPFSKLDMISCRNLLIYMNKELQKKLIPMFHYALNPGGLLFLGTSESIGDFPNLFEPLDKQYKIYRSKAAQNEYNYSVGSFFPTMGGTSGNSKSHEPSSNHKKLQMRELTERNLLQQYAPTGALVNEYGDILYLHGRTGMYLEMPPGEPDHNILKMAREGLRPALTNALSRLVVNKELKVTHSKVRVKTNGDFTTVDLNIRQVEETGNQKLFLVTFDPYELKEGKQEVTVDKNDYKTDTPAEEESVSALREELRTMEEYLRASNEELEVSNEELRSSNEEMQSMNEELQSTNEELETSREELQSVNEELSTVNNELQAKVAELSEANEDMNNVLAATGVAIIFVDNQLRIQRFTPAAIHIMNLIPADVGRPVKHIVSNLSGYDQLIQDIQSVMDDLTPLEIEVHTTDGEWYVVRMRPYRTIKNTIEGVVITFLKQTETLRRLAAVVQDSHDAIILQDKEGRILAWNPAAERMYGWNEVEALEMNITRIIPEDKKEEYMELVKKLVRGETPEPWQTQRVSKEGHMMDVWLIATPLINENGEVYSIATTEKEVRP